MRILIVLLLAAAAWAAPAIVIVVRHAEKAAAPADDPPLNDAGTRRARDLADVVAAWTAAGGKVTALIASDTKRALLTLSPLSAASGVMVTVVPAKDYDVLARKVMAVKGGVVVVAGHSKTVPAILKRLGAAGEVVIEDAEYGRLFAITAPGGAGARMVELCYGQ